MIQRLVVDFNDIYLGEGLDMTKMITCIETKVCLFSLIRTQPQQKLVGEENVITFHRLQPNT